MFSDKDLKNMARIKRLTNEEVLVEILRCEGFADENLKAGKITQAQAWDIYFGLMHECDERGLLDDARRLVSKIDTRIYNPFESEDSGMRYLALMRYQMQRQRMSAIARYN